MESMRADVTEIADGIYRISTFVPEVAPPAGFTFNQFLVVADEPLIFHTGARGMFPLVSAGVSKVLPPETVRWISFGHVESDESGAMNEWLAIAPQATVAQGQIACMVSLGDLADRPPRALDDGEKLDIGGHVVQWFDTPHVPHAWECGVLYDATTRTLFCGDLFTRFGEYEATTTDDIVGPAVAAEDSAPGSLSLHPTSATVIRRLADLPVDTLAPMHAPAFTGDCRAALLDLAADFQRRIDALA